MRILDVHWKSVQASLKSTFRLKSSFKLVQAKYGSGSDFTFFLMVDDDLFDSIQESENSIPQLILASFLMQRDSNTLADSVDVLGEYSKVFPFINHFQLILFIYRGSGRNNKNNLYLYWHK